MTKLQPAFPPLSPSAVLGDRASNECTTFEHTLFMLDDDGLIGGHDILHYPHSNARPTHAAFDD